MAEGPYANWVAPWGDRPSLYDFIDEHIDDNDEFDGPPLPDELDDGGIRWAPGAHDGVMTHHMAQGVDEATADALAALLRTAIADLSDEATLCDLYDALVNVDVLSVLDALVERVLADVADPDALRQIAGWLTLESADRAPVKVGMALLGVFRTDAFRSVFGTLGRHDEFTLYAAVALDNALEDAESALFELAQHVHGWGRIHLVERLTETTRPDIRAWMLREGFRNGVMNAYLAVPCATTGRLHEALAVPEVDAALMAGARDLIDALIAEGPVQGMTRYEQGPSAVGRWVERVEPGVADLPVLIAVRDWLTAQRSRDAQHVIEALGWTEATRQNLLTTIERHLSDPDWPARVTAILVAPPHPEPDSTAGRASRAQRGSVLRTVETFGIDAWPHDYAYVERGGEGWHRLWGTRDPERMDQALILAEARLDLDAPANHRHLEGLVFALAHHPGRGWRFIRAALTNPLPRRRRRALQTLDGWDRTVWTEHVRDQLAQLADSDPDAEVRHMAEALVAGKRLDDVRGEE